MKSTETEKQLISFRVIEADQVAMLLRKTREANGMRQQDVADKAGIDKGTYATYEHGKRSPQVYILEAVLNALGYDLKIMVVKRGTV